MNATDITDWETKDSIKMPEDPLRNNAKCNYMYEYNFLMKKLLTGLRIVYFDETFSI